MVMRSGVEVVRQGPYVMVYNEFRGLTEGGYTVGSGVMVSTPETRQILKVTNLAVECPENYDLSASGLIRPVVKKKSGNIVTIGLYTGSGEVSAGMGLSSYIFRLDTLGTV